ncbi:MAG: radical SAM protein [Phycisphaerae bacterium]
MATETLEPITAAGLLVTDYCPARCRHCYVSAGPDGKRWMTADAARGHFAALRRLGVSADGIHIGGGEPFGRGTQADFDRLLAIVRAARQAGLDGVGYVETGGAWAVSETRAREWLSALAEAGMRQLAVSADPYHQEFIPAERVRLLYEVAANILPSGGVRARRWRWLQSPQDVAAMGENERKSLFQSTLERYPERMTGRAAEELAPLVGRVPIGEVPDDGCAKALLASGHVHVDPEGWVYPGTCVGITLGRATAERPLDELLCGWRVGDWPRIALLAAGGPKRLLDEAERDGFEADPAGYAGKCHLCWSVRRHLVQSGAGGEDFAPESLYVEMRVTQSKENRR